MRLVLPDKLRILQNRIQPFCIVTPDLTVELRPDAPKEIKRLFEEYKKESDLMWSKIETVC